MADIKGELVPFLITELSTAPSSAVMRRSKLPQVLPPLGSEDKEKSQVRTSRDRVGDPSRTQAGATVDSTGVTTDSTVARVYSDPAVSVASSRISQFISPQKLTSSLTSPHGSLNPDRFSGPRSKALGYTSPGKATSLASDSRNPSQRYPVARPRENEPYNPYLKPLSPTKSSHSKLPPLPSSIRDHGASRLGSDKKEYFSPQKSECFSPRKSEYFSPRKSEYFSPRKSEYFSPRKSEHFSPRKSEYFSPRKGDKVIPLPPIVADAKDPMPLDSQSKGESLSTVSRTLKFEGGLECDKEMPIPTYLSQIPMAATKDQTSQSKGKSPSKPSEKNGDRAECTSISSPPESDIGTSLKAVAQPPNSQTDYVSSAHLYLPAHLFEELNVRFENIIRASEAKEPYSMDLQRVKAILTAAEIVKERRKGGRPRISDAAFELQPKLNTVEMLDQSIHDDELDFLTEDMKGEYLSDCDVLLRDVMRSEETPQYVLKRIRAIHELRDIIRVKKSS